MVQLRALSKSLTDAEQLLLFRFYRSSDERRDLTIPNLSSTAGKSVWPFARLRDDYGFGDMRARSSSGAEAQILVDNLKCRVQAKANDLVFAAVEGSLSRCWRSSRPC